AAHPLQIRGSSMRVEAQHNADGLSAMSIFDEAKEEASEKLAALSREIEVFGSGSVKGFSDTAAARWHDNPYGLAIETAAIGAGGVALGMLGHNNRLLANGLTALGASTFVLFEAPRLPYREFGQAWNTAWTSKDGHELSKATNQ